MTDSEFDQWYVNDGSLKSAAYEGLVAKPAELDQWQKGYEQKVKENGHLRAEWHHEIERSKLYKESWDKLYNIKFLELEAAIEDFKRARGKNGT